jgi:hypothetical protein
MACDDFYTPADTPTPGPTATPVPPGALPTGEAALTARLLNAAQEALEIRTGGPVFGLRVESIEGRPFTDADPGCLPPPDNYFGTYVRPGVVASLRWDGIRYEFHADALGGGGALCDSVRQLLFFTPLGSLGFVIAPERFVGQTVFLRSETEAVAFERANARDIAIFEEQIDWPLESLAGTTFAGSGCEYDVSAESVEWLVDLNVVRISVLEDETGSCEQEHLVSVFLLIEEAPPDAVIEFRVVETIQLQTSSGTIEVTATPDIQLEAIQTALAGGN